MTEQMTKTEALALAATEWWLHATHRQIAEFQMAQNLLCCPFGVFHEAVEKTLERPVFIHELLNRDGILAELRGEQAAPTIADILALIPADKLIVLDATSLREDTNG